MSWSIFSTIFANFQLKNEGLKKQCYHQYLAFTCSILIKKRQLISQNFSAKIFSKSLIRSVPGRLHQLFKCIIFVLPTNRFSLSLITLKCLHSACLLRPVVNFATRGEIRHPGVKFSPQGLTLSPTGEVIPWGWKIICSLLHFSKH
jgi:hypothetical protein